MPRNPRNLVHENILDLEENQAMFLETPIPGQSRSIEAQMNELRQMITQMA